MEKFKDLKNKVILISGATGLIGSNLIEEYLDYEADVYGFPTIKLYQNGNNTNDFNLDRTANNLFKFLKLNNLLNSKKVKNKRSKKKKLSQKRKRNYNRSKVNK